MSLKLKQRNWCLPEKLGTLSLFFKAILTLKSYFLYLKLLKIGNARKLVIVVKNLSTRKYFTNRNNWTNLVLRKWVTLRSFKSWKLWSDLALSQHCCLQWQTGYLQPCWTFACTANCLKRQTPSCASRTQNLWTPWFPATSRMFLSRSRTSWSIRNPKESWTPSS